MSAPIKTLTGLQNLPNLRELRADWNALESIDLSGCTNLEWIDISDCDLTDGSGNPSLTQVNITGCTSLIELRVDDSDFSQNGIGSIIGLAGASSLVAVDLDQCGISGAVDLSSLSSLETLDLSGNTGITSVSISISKPILNLYLGGCALTQSAVNSIVTQLAASTIISGYLDVSSGTNASPSVAASAALATLDSKSWGQSYNYPISVQWDLTASSDPAAACAANDPMTSYSVTHYTASGTLTQGNIFYGNMLLTQYASDGLWYSDGSIRFQTVSGVIQTPVACV
jgi:hypothetical protein